MHIKAYSSKIVFFNTDFSVNLTEKSVLYTWVCTHKHRCTVEQPAWVRMPAFSTVIMGLYPTVMHSSLRLALLQMERQQGKGTGCHNLSSHSGQEPQLQTLTHIHTPKRTGQSTINPHGCLHVWNTETATCRGMRLKTRQKWCKSTSTSRSCALSHAAHFTKSVGCNRAAPLCDRRRK